MLFGFWIINKKKLYTLLSEPLGPVYLSVPRVRVRVWYPCSRKKNGSKCLIFIHIIKYLWMFLNLESSFGHFFKLKIFICLNIFLKIKSCNIMQIHWPISNLKLIFFYSTRNTSEKVRYLQKCIFFPFRMSLDSIQQKFENKILLMGHKRC